MPFNKRNNKNKWGKIKKEQVFEKSEYKYQEQLLDDEVGISEYISKLNGYPAVIKARFSDFQVNEINLDGEMAKLTNTSIPQEFASKATFEDVHESPIEEITQECWEALKNLAKNSKGDPVILKVENLSKDDRKKIHTCIKKHFGQKIVPTTIVEKTEKIIKCEAYNNAEQNNRFQWPVDLPEYVHFIVFKELMDTMDACFKISQALKISPTHISYAGVKDKRAKTSQWFCIKKVQPWKLLKQIRSIRNIRIGNITFKERCLKIGELKGNRFRIALRNVIADDDLISQSMEQLKKFGFINYYGLQRFGNDKEVPTFLIGVKLLLGQWKEAVDLILKVKNADDMSLPINKAKQCFAETGDASKALALCKEKRNSLEINLLEGFAKNHKNAYVNALENIPRNVRLMYIHSFQSLIWNKMASIRVKEFGMTPVEGDLVFVDKCQVEEALNENDEDSDMPPKPESKNQLVRPLTKDELHNYTIYDVVLPLPGYDITYPENLKQYYKQSTEEYGLSLEMPKQSVKTYNLSGTYRKLLGQVQNLEWKIMYYDDPKDNLIRSDLGEMLEQEEPQSIENGKYKAVVLAFTLNSSSYATMVLREILKCKTSSSVQSQLNNYGESLKKHDKPKVLVESTNGTQEVPEHNQDTTEILPGSLLADKAKYEDFKNNLFKDILGDGEGESSGKRDLEDEIDASSKKMKTE